MSEVAATVAIQPEDPSRECPISTIPPEILSTIITKLRKKDLFSVTQTCRRLCQIARSHISGGMTIPVDLNPNGISVPDFSVFLGAWKDAITGISMILPHMTGANSIAVFNAITNLPRLTKISVFWPEVHLMGDRRQHDIALRALLAYLTEIGTKITEAEISMVYDGQEEEELAPPELTQTVLSMCKNLTSLTISCAQLPRNITITHPNLREITFESIVYGPLEAIAARAPGLEKIVVRASQGPDEHDIENEIGTVKYVRHCPKLRYLEITNRGTEDYVMDASALSACKRLEVLKIGDACVNLPSIRSLRVLSVGRLEYGTTDQEGDDYSDGEEDEEEKTEPEFGNLESITINGNGEESPLGNQDSEYSFIAQSGNTLKFLDLARIEWGEPDFAPLGKLTTLILYDIDLPDGVFSLANHPHLKKLHLTNVPIKSLGESTGKSCLKSVSIKGCPCLTDISTLTDSPIESLEIENSPIKSITPLATCEKFRKLRIIKTQISNISPIAGSQLEHIDIENCPVSDLSPLSGCENITQIALRNLSITSLDTLSGLPLVKVTLWSLPNMVSLQPLSSCQQLQDVLLYEMPRIVSLSPLGSCPHLKSIHAVRAPKLTKIDGLRGHPNLESVHIEGAVCLDVSALATCPSLRHYRSSSVIGAPLAHQSERVVLETVRKNQKAARLPVEY